MEVGERWQNESVENEDCGIDGRKGKKAPLSSWPPSQLKRLHLGLRRWRKDGGGRAVGGVGQSPSSLPTQQLAQMAAEAGPSKSGREEPACKKFWPTMGGKAPPKEFLWACQVKKAQKVLAWDSCPLQDMQFQKSTELLIQKLPFSWLVCKIVIQVGKYDMHFQGHTIICCRKLQRHM